MRAARSKKRRLLKLLLWALVALALLLAALPIWFPWALRPIAKSYGVHFDRYERLGYTRFALAGVKSQRGTFRFEARRVEAFLPTRWLWLRYLGAEKPSHRVHLDVTEWRLKGGTEGPRSRPSSEQGGPQSTVAVLEQFETALQPLRAWLPTARLTKGEIIAGSIQARVDAIVWNRGQLKLSANLESPRVAQTLSLRADLSGSARYLLSVGIDPLDMEIKARLLREKSSWKLEGRAHWVENELNFAGRFDPGNWRPEQAHVTAERFRVPADLLDLPGYEDLTGSLSFHLERRTFRLEVSARANPKSAETAQSPPVEVNLRAGGDSESALVEKLAIATPWLQVNATENVKVRFSRPWLTDPAHLQLAIDLTKLPGSPFGGTLEGKAEIQPADNFPRASFEIAGAGLSGHGVSVEDLRIAGRLIWPVLEIERTEIAFADASTLAANAQLNLETRTIVKGNWEINGGFLRPFLPPGWDYRTLQACGECSGPLNDLRHSGHIEADKVLVPRLAPLHVQATWRAQRLNFSEAEVELRAGESALHLDGTVKVDETTTWQTSVNLQTLTLQREEQPVYRLDQPCAISFQSGRLKVSPCRWTGTERELGFQADVDWPGRGTIQSRWRGVALDDFRDFLALPEGDISIEALDLAAEWENGPLILDLGMRGSLKAPDGSPFSAQASFKGGETGLKVESLTVSGQYGKVVSVEGTIPVIVVPKRGAAMLEIAEGQPIDVRAATEPNNVFWERVAELTGVQLVDPKVELALRGTTTSPEGHLRVQASLVDLKIPQEKWPIPKMEKLEIDATVNQDTVRLERFGLEVEGQAVAMTGDLPLEKNFWSHLLAGGAFPDWKHANARLQIADAQLAPFVRYLPTVLSPQGRLNLDLALRPGGTLEGELRIADAATRPLMPLGPIREIEARVKFSDRTATIETLRGRLGGQPATLTGRIKLLEGGRSEFDFALQGKNVPLARQPGLILRSDVDIHLAQRKDKPPVISGELVLRDSFFLQELQVLVPGRLAQPKQRPPFFSVEEEPFADWALDLKIKGDRFLRVRNPVFQGEVSAHFGLQGTLREPIALGEARINSGLVQFPFATFRVDHGSATLTSENPYQPELFLTASSQTFGYTLRMEVSGHADQPLVNFSAIPSLSSEEIVLMITTGELPRSDFAFTSEQKIARLGLFLGKDLLNKLGAGESAADRLTIRTGENISEQGTLTYSLEYRLSKRWSLVGELDRFNEVNAGLKFRVYSK